MAVSTFAATETIQEALNPPDNFVAISTPAVMAEFIYAIDRSTALSNNVLSQFNIIKNLHETGLNTTYEIAGFWDKSLEVETVLKFPCLIQIIS
jgi:hypothetical protein